MSTIVVTDDCIGCESCVEVCPDVFEMSGNMAYPKDVESTLPCVDEAIEICPVDAIHREG